MQAKILVYAALLSLGFVIPARASTRPLPLPPPPVQALDAPAISAPRQKPVAPPVLPRGQMLYENHCMSCHASVVHIRGNHRTQSLMALRGRVTHWAGYLHLSWGRDEIEAVVIHLNNHYYKFESR